MKGCHSRNDFSPFLSIPAISLYNILELALVSAGNEDLATILNEGKGDHQANSYVYRQ
jgi:hypothetical protein